MIFEPSLWATGTWGTFTWGVTKPYRLASLRDLTLQKHADSFSESTIQGHIRRLTAKEAEIYSGGSLDEVHRILITQAGVKNMDRIYDESQQAYYQVELVQDIHDGASFSHRTALIRKMLPS